MSKKEEQFNKWLRESRRMLENDISSFLIRKRLVPKSSHVVIPPSYDWEEENHNILWSGGFEVFSKDGNTIILTGNFNANMLEGIGKQEDYGLELSNVGTKKKLLEVF